MDIVDVDAWFAMPSVYVLLRMNNGVNSNRLKDSTSNEMRFQMRAIPKPPDPHNSGLFDDPVAALDRVKSTV